MRRSVALVCNILDNVVDAALGCEAQAVTLGAMPNIPHLTSNPPENRSAVAAVAIPPLGLLTQKEAAAYLRVSPAYLRASSCPKILLPGNGRRGRPMVRYRVEDLIAWAECRLMRQPRSA